MKQHTNHSAAFLHFIAMGCKMPFIMEPTNKNGKFISQFLNFYKLIQVQTIETIFCYFNELWSMCS